MVWEWLVCSLCSKANGYLLSGKHFFGFAVAVAVGSS
jgi:hypothetical protein